MRELCEEDKVFFCGPPIRKDSFRSVFGIPIERQLLYSTAA